MAEKYKNITRSYGGEETHYVPSEVEAKASQVDVAKQRLDYNLYEPDIRAWQVRQGELHPEYAWHERRMRTLGDREKYAPYARQYMYKTRDQQQQAMHMLAATARGDRSVARMEAENQRRRIAQGIASQLASQRGRLPTAVRGAQMSQGKAMVDLAAQTEVAAAKEKMAAQQAYAQALGGMRSQDLSMLGTEMQQDQALRAWMLAKEKAAMDYRKMGLGEKYATAGLRQQYEQLQTAQDMALLDQAIRLQTGGQGGGGTNWGQVMGGIGSMIGGIGLMALGFPSDKRTKKDIEYLTPSGEACKQALASGNVALYNYLQAQASGQNPGIAGVAQPGGLAAQQPVAPGAQPVTPGTVDPSRVKKYEKDYSDYPGVKVGDFTPYEAPKKLPNTGDPTYFIPGVTGYGGYKKEYYPRGYAMDPAYAEGWARNWRAKPEPLRIDPNKQPGIDASQFQPYDPNDPRNKPRQPIPAPIPPQPGPQIQKQPYWMPDKTPSGLACKEALASGNVALYNYLQSQQTGEALDTQFGMNPTMNALGAGAGAAGWNPTVSALAASQQPAAQASPAAAPTAGWNPTMAALGSPSTANVSPVAPAQPEMPPLETNAEAQARALASQKALDTAIQSGQTSQYTRTGGLPTGAGDINPDYAVSVTPAQAEIAAKGAGDAGGKGNPAAAAAGVSGVFQGMGAIIDHIDKAERRKEGHLPENWAGVSKGTPGFANQINSLLRPPKSGGSSYGMGMDMIAAASDERCKEDIADDSKLDDFLGKMQAVQFNYKDPEAHGYGRRTGVLADDVAASELGDGMVMTGPDGNLMLDVSPQKFNPLVLASLAHLHKRVQNLEGGE